MAITDANRRAKRKWQAKHIANRPRCLRCNEHIVSRSKYCSTHSLNHILGRRDFNCLNSQTKQIGLCPSQMDREGMLVLYVWLDAMRELYNFNPRKNEHKRER